MNLKPIIAVFSVMLLSCISIKNQAEYVETNSTAEIEAKKIAAAKMLEDGYLPGRVIYSELADDCEYTIQLKDGERDFYYVDPINLVENFRKDDQTIWVKFNDLKTMNRCENAAPVEITEIENRDS